MHSNLSKDIICVFFVIPVVDWMSPVGKRTWYHLNLKEGLWEVSYLLTLFNKKCLATNKVTVMYFNYKQFITTEYFFAI